MVKLKNKQLIGLIVLVVIGAYINSQYLSFASSLTLYGVSDNTLCSIDGPTFITQYRPGWAGKRSGVEVGMGGIPYGLFLTC